MLGKAQEEKPNEKSREIQAFSANQISVNKNIQEIFPL